MTLLTLGYAARALCDSCYVGGYGESMSFDEKAYNTLLSELHEYEKVPVTTGLTPEAAYNHECMCRQERATKGRIAAELQSLLAQYTHDDPGVYRAVEIFKEQLFKEAAP